MEAIPVPGPVRGHRVVDTRAKAKERRSPDRRGRAGAAVSRLVRSLLQRALGPLIPPAESADKLQLEAFEPRVLMSGDGLVPRIDGRIDVPGEVDRYSFTLAQDVRIVFDSLTSDNAFQWSLDGPDGRVVAPTGFGSSDSANRSGDTAPLLRAGSYTLSVDATGDRTGDYAFRLIDLSRATALQPGQVVSGDLAQGNASSTASSARPRPSGGCWAPTAARSSMSLQCRPTCRTCRWRRPAATRC